MKKIYNFILILFCIVGTLHSQNTALRFDGVSEYITIANKPILNVGDTYTIEAWIFAENWKAQSW